MSLQEEWAQCEDSYPHAYGERPGSSCRVGDLSLALCQVVLRTGCFSMVLFPVEISPDSFLMVSSSGTIRAIEHEKKREECTDDR